MRIDMRRRRQPLSYRKHRALIDGEDVTTRCFLADDDEGIVGLYLQDATGHFYKDGDDVAHEFRKGVVTIIPPVAAH